MQKSFSGKFIAAGAALSLLALAGGARGQAVKWEPDPSLPPPPVTFRGLIPGVATLEEAREKLGAPRHEAFWYAYKMLYPAMDRPGHLDALHFKSRDGKTGRLGNIEAASVPEGFESLEKVRARLGEPEFLLELHRHALADYSARGVRIVFDASGRTIGAAYIPHGRTRVHSGERRSLSLRRKPQGPQPAPAAPPDLAGLRAGAAEADITPRAEWLSPEIQKAGFSVHDPLKARCAVIERGELRVAIVGADLFGMEKSEIDPIEEGLRRDGIDHLLLAMSHNHAAPDSIGIYGHYPAEYVAYVQAQVRRGVLEAAAALRPVKRWAAASEELALDGARVEGLSRNARNPGIVDPQLAVMQAVGEDGRPIATFVHFTCHVEGLEKGVLECSADFPGYLCESLKKDPGGIAIFLNGALGGMVSGDTSARTHEEAAAAGERLAREARRLLGAAVPPAAMRCSFERRRLEIPMTNPKFILFSTMSGRRPGIRGRVATEMFLLRLGDAEIVTIPGELLPELSFEILERMDGYPRMIVGLANDELGYMIPGYDFNAGDYEEGMSVGPAAGPMARDLALRMIEFARNPAPSTQSR